MAVSDEFVDLIKDQLAQFGHVTFKKMFGGVGLFARGVMFGLIVDDILYFKKDDDNAKMFEDEGLGSFGYESKTGKRTVMSYCRAPERVFDEADEMMIWADTGMQAAIRADHAKPKSKQKLTS